MSGRKLFQYVKPFAFFLSNLFKLFPSFIRHLLWDFSSPFNGNLSVLLRYALFNAEAKSCGDNVYFGKNVTIKNMNKISIGNNVSIHEGCYVDGIGEIEIGDDVSIAHQVSLVSFNHSFDDASTPIKYNVIKLGKIILCDDVWIGCGVRVLAGVCISSRVVIAAGAVVNCSIPQGSLVAGVPAKLIRKI